MEFSSFSVYVLLLIIFHGIISKHDTETAPKRFMLEKVHLRLNESGHEILLKLVYERIFISI